MDPSAWEDFVSDLRDQASAAGADIAAAADDIAAYVSARAEHLSTLVNEPGFYMAVTAERDNVALKAGIRAVAEADALDARVLGIIEGALAFAAKALKPV